MNVATSVLWVTLAIWVAILVGGVLLQIFLSRRENKWLGLILPLISFLISLTGPLSVMDSGNLGRNILMMLVTLLLSNIPTVILLAIYYAAREKLRKRSELDKTRIDDL